MNSKDPYDLGRLTPNKDNKYFTDWTSMCRFEKVCWYVSTMTAMCTDFLARLDNSSYRIISYDTFVKDHSLFENVFNWLDLNFDINKIDKVFSKQIGSSARSKSELNFEVNERKIKNTKHWKNWSDKKKDMYIKFFGTWQCLH